MLGYYWGVGVTSHNEEMTSYLLQNTDIFIVRIVSSHKDTVGDDGDHNNHTKKSNLG